MPAPWVRDPDDPAVRHRGGQPWYARRVPWRFHTCVAQSVTVLWVDAPDGTRRATGVVRCACGAVANSETGGAWRERNSRRKAAADPALRRSPRPA